MDFRMQREEASAQEVFSYAQMSTLERNSGIGTLSRHLERERLERDRYIVDVRNSDLQQDKPGPLHPCFSYRVWLYSVVKGSSLLIVAASSLYIGNVFPAAMDYLRCAAGSMKPLAGLTLTLCLAFRISEYTSSSGELHYCQEQTSCTCY
ncbi:membrane protein MLC1-like [Myxocyprinus asiaticus]|uniref:membrane protein MLC1-like n=1 Tax=Myxocyprinus asiaticus TaxID=70543 RepID=UPI002222DAEC|nr:membrane protein MLC1-like [Myxocyprinus asiaticus]